MPAVLQAMRSSSLRIGCGVLVCLSSTLRLWCAPIHASVRPIKELVVEIRHGDRSALEELAVSSPSSKRDIHLLFQLIADGGQESPLFKAAESALLQTRDPKLLEVIAAYANKRTYWNLSEHLYNKGLPIPYLISMGKSWQRLAATRVLAQLGDSTMVPLLEARTHDRLWEVEAAAARGLARIQGVRSIPFLRRRLGRPGGSRAVGGALQEIGGPALRALVEAYERKEVGYKADDAYEIGFIIEGFRDPASRDLLQHLCAHKDFHIRFNAISALGKMRMMEAIPTLIQVLNSTDDIDRARAVTALGEIGDKSVLPYLRKALKDGSVEVRDAAAEALLKMTGENHSQK